MSEMESKAALWHKKKEFRAIWGNPGSLQPLGRNNMSQLLLYTLSRVLANRPQLYCPVTVLILAKREVVELQEKSMRRMLSGLQPVKPILCEGGIGKGLFLSKSPEHFLLFHPNRGFENLQETLFQLFKVPAKNLQDKSDA